MRRRSLDLNCLSQLRWLCRDRFDFNCLRCLRRSHHYRLLGIRCKVKICWRRRLGVWSGQAGRPQRFRESSLFRLTRNCVGLGRLPTFGHSVHLQGLRREDSVNTSVVYCRHWGDDVKSLRMIDFLYFVLITSDWMTKGKFCRVHTVFSYAERFVSRYVIAKPHQNEALHKFRANRRFYWDASRTRRGVQTALARDERMFDHVSRVLHGCRAQ